jgi:tRNA (guanine-N7-)-methyltransferase
MNDETATARRTVRSYVLRGGRITEAQQRALNDCWPRFGLEVGSAPWPLATVFGRSAPCTLEIGFGNGTHLAARASAEPERDFIGVEVHRPGVGRLLLRAASDNLQNLRVACHDAVEVLQVAVAPGSLDEIQILFPDPWHKKRHHKRRLIQPSFVALAASRLRPGGILHLATDWEPYAQQMREVLAGCELLENTMPGDAFSPRPRQRAATRFEQRGARLGHAVFDLVWRRRSDATQ